MINQLPNAIIVGGSRGIGFAVAKKFIQNSFNVTIISRNSQNLIKSVDILAKEMPSNNQIDYQCCDVSHEEDIGKTCQYLINSICSEKKQKIDCLVNCAGISYDKLLMMSTVSDIQTVLNTNLLGTILFSKLIAKQMIKQKKGSIINIGSIIGINGNAGQTIYSASKSALTGFTKSLAKELGPKNITVNLIAPGFIKTDMTDSTMASRNNQIGKLQKMIPLQRIGHPEEVADACYFLATSSFITGSILVVDGGLNLTL